MMSIRRRGSAECQNRVVKNTAPAQHFKLERDSLRDNMDEANPNFDKLFASLLHLCCSWFHTTAKE